MNSGRFLSNLYSAIIWTSLTSWIVNSRSSKSSSLISIKFKAIYRKTISILMKINIRINSNGTKIRFNIKIRATIRINFKETSIHTTMFKDITLKNKIFTSQTCIKTMKIFKIIRKRCICRNFTKCNKIIFKILIEICK